MIERDCNLTDVMVIHPTQTITGNTSATTGYYTTTGTTSVLSAGWDYNYVSANFHQMAVAINALNHEVKALKKLYWWLLDTHPEVIEKYVVSEAVLERMERKQ